MTKLNSELLLLTSRKKDKNMKMFMEVKWALDSPSREPVSVSCLTRYLDT